MINTPYRACSECNLRECDDNRCYRNMNKEELLNLARGANRNYQESEANPKKYYSA